MNVADLTKYACWVADELRKELVTLAIRLAEAKPKQRVELVKALVDLGIDPHELVMRHGHWQTDQLMVLNAVVPDMDERKWDWHKRTLNPVLKLLEAAKVYI